MLYKASTSPGFGQRMGRRKFRREAFSESMIEESDQVWSASEAAAPSLSLASRWRQFAAQVQEQAQAKFQSKGGKSQSRTATWPLHDIRR